MADEFTATSATNIINSEWIAPAFQDYAREYLVCVQFLKEYNLIGKGTAQVAVPSIASAMGTVSDGGASVATAFDATDGTDLSNTAMTLTQATIATSEMGVMREITDQAIEQTVDGFDLIGEIVNDNARILATALEDDACALLANFSNTVGASGSDMTLANLDSAIIGIRTRGIRAMDGLAGVLDDEQANNFEVAVGAASTSMSVHDATEDRFRAIERDLNNGLTDARFARYKNINLYMTGLTDTANTAADVTGAIFVPDTPGNTRMAALGIAWSRRVRFASERNESKRSLEIVTSQAVGVGELLDAAGTSIVTDAPT